MERTSLDWRRFDALSRAALYEALRLRQSVFVVEQRSPYADLDGLDECARHLLAREARALVGYLRLVDTGTAVRIGRVAVVPARRGRGLGRRMMRAALDFCRQHHAGMPVVLDAQLAVVPFYESLGFTVSGEPYDDCGIAHVAMILSRRAG